MVVFGWVLGGLLAAVFLATGIAKLTLPKDRLAKWQGGWVRDFSQRQIRAIGALEVLGAAGLIVPQALGILPVLVPVAAVGLALLMTGALIINMRGEQDAELLGMVNVVLLVLAVSLAYERLSPFPNA